MATKNKPRIGAYRATVATMEAEKDASHGLYLASQPDTPREVLDLLTGSEWLREAAKAGDWVAMRTLELAEAGKSE